MLYGIAFVLAIAGVLCCTVCVVCVGCVDCVSAVVCRFGAVCVLRLCCVSCWWFVCGSCWGFDLCWLMCVGVMYVVGECAVLCFACVRFLCLE